MSVWIRWSLREYLAPIVREWRTKMNPIKLSKYSFEGDRQSKVEVRHNVE